MVKTKEIIELLNPWWKEDSISSELAKPYKRKIFDQLLKLLKHRQIIILSGLRRVGKTTLLYQSIENLLSKIDSKHIFYFNFDKKVEEITEVLKAFEELTKINWKKEKIFVFFDEIAKLKEWANKIKLIYDAFPNIKFFVSSSSSVGLEKEAIKNLAGRYFLRNIKPLNFIEFLELKKKNKFLENIKLYEKEIKKELKQYSLRSFPEIIDWEDELLIKDYLKTTIIDKVVREDLPDKFKKVNKDLLLTLVDIFYKEPGMYLDYDDISQTLRISKKTLIQHIYYLEFSYLIRRIKNFRMSSLATSRKMQRIYPYWWSLTYCYTNNPDKIMENMVASLIDAKIYWRKNGKEIDFLIKENKQIIPIEVKNKIRANRTDLKTMKYFLTKYEKKEGILIYLGEEDEIKLDKSKIRLMPLWKCCLKNEFEIPKKKIL